MTGLLDWLDKNIGSDDRITRAKKFVILFVCLFSCIGLLANYLLFVFRHDDVAFYDHVILLVAPLLLVATAPRYCVESRDIGRAANHVFGASYLIILANTLHAGSIITTVIYFMLALSVCYSLLYGWRGFAIAAAVSLAHIVVFVGLEDLLRFDFTLAYRHDDITTPSELSGTLKSYGLVFLTAASCAAAFHHQMSKAVEELAEARRAADEANAAKSEFLANMSHEIRTPMNGVLGMAQVLQSENLSPRQSEAVNVIVDSGRTLTALLNDVLDFSKIEAGKLAISPISGDPADTIQSVLKLFGPAATDKGLGLALHCDASVPARLVFDPVRVRQCVSNLVSNAIKFTQSGSVTVSLFAEPAEAEGALMLRVDVADTGIGIEEGVQARLFSPFTQADGTTTRRFGGTGLGLVISRRLARLMGGDITVGSVPGEGAVFSLTLLAQEEHGESRSQAGNVSSSTKVTRSPMVLEHRAPRVLLVDDNAINRRIIRLFLEPLGCVIVEAVNGQEALDVLEAERFDIVLLDVHMPVMDGREAIRRIRGGRREWKYLPVIALTADAMDGDRERYLAMGMSDYVSKPIDQRELLSIISTALALASEPPEALAS